MNPEARLSTFSKKQPLLPIPNSLSTTTFVGHNHSSSTTANTTTTTNGIEPLQNVVCDSIQRPTPPLKPNRDGSIKLKSNKKSLKAKSNASIDSLTSSSSTNLTESKTPEHQQHSSSNSSSTTPEFCRIHLRQTANLSNSKNSADSESTSESVPSSVGMAIRLFSEYASSRCQDTKSTGTTTTTSTSENEQLTDTIRSLLETVQLLIKYIRQVQKNRQSKFIMSNSTMTIDDNNEIINGKMFSTTPTTITLINDINIFGERCLELSKIISPQIGFKLREHIQNIKDISKPLLDNDDNRDETSIFSQMTKILQDIKIILDKF